MQIRHPVIIEPGVTINQSAAIYFNSTVQAIGSDSGANAITFNNQSCGASVQNQGSPHGSGQKIKYKFVKFIGLSIMEMNGGTIESSTYDNSACSFLSGGIRKTGYDPLIIKNNNFIAIASLVTVVDGFTAVENNTGTIANVVTLQGGDISLLDNSLSLAGSCTLGDYKSFIAAGRGGNITSAENNVVSGVCDFLKISGPIDFEIDGGFTVNNCLAAVGVENITENLGKATIKNIDFSGCEYAYYNASTAYAPPTGQKVLFQNNDINVTEALVKIKKQFFGNDWSATNFGITFDLNDIECVHASTTDCELFHIENGTGMDDNLGHYALGLTKNNITCSTGACTGFRADTGSTRVLTFSSEIALGTNACSTSNYYIGRTLKASIASGIENNAACATEICISEYEDVDITGTWTFPSNDSAGAIIPGTGPQ